MASEGLALIALAAGFAIGWGAFALKTKLWSEAGGDGADEPSNGAAAESPREEPGPRYGPLQLTEYGEGIAEKLNAKVWVQQTADELENTVAGKKAFEIDQIAKKRAGEYLGRAFEQRIDEVVYEAGSSRDRINPILAVMLRNELLRRTGGESDTAIARAGEERAATGTQHQA